MQVDEASTSHGEHPAGNRGEHRLGSGQAAIDWDPFRGREACSGIKPKRLRKACHWYIRSVVAEFNSFDPRRLSQAQGELHQAISNKLPPDIDALGYDAATTLELLNLSFMGEEQLRLRALGLRDAYAKLLAEQPPYLKDGSDASARKEKAWLEQARSHLRSLHWFQASEYERQRILHHLTWSACLPAIIVCGLFITLIVLMALGTDVFVWLRSLGVRIQQPGTELRQRVLLLSLVMLASTLGSFLSVLRRLQEAAKGPSVFAGDQPSELAALRYGALTVRLSALFGLVTGPVTYYLMASGLVTGPLFPSFTEKCEPMQSNFVLFACLPASTTGSWAKLIIWCFVAGFLERFVPDTLDMLERKSRGTAAGS